MASEAEMSELSSLFERLMRHRDFSMFLPFIFGFANNIPRPDSQGPDEENENRENPRDRVVLINPFTQNMMVIDGVSSLDSLFRELGGKDGQPPTSKASIEAMPCVEIEEKGVECVICLEEFQVGGVAKVMPCKHRFHGDCIEKWLGMHGSCPVCRHNMPVDEEELGKKRDEEGRERRSRGEVWVSFSFNSGRSSQDSNQIPSSDSNVDDSTSSPAAARDDEV
ncbi:hypothetical protein FNV43_RR26205 [Rhamnella rubrinervis]|uniref:RING-type E3 ubiquitin transferase n=1 Tax=Rhamnella rubrinervis TaxID=2594499 RepID=A0A8K0DNM5_9ROSA|nr:hypothetical protein FNV43_RR26205 [Rhamnella rubrinervis]